MAGNGILYVGMALAGIVMTGAQLGTVEPGPGRVAPPQVSSAAASSDLPSVSNGQGSVALERGQDSHFYAEALVNGARIRFLVDTGASSVVLTPADARRAGLGTGDFDAKGIGAGGEIKLMPVALTRLALGPIVAENVPAVVAEEGALPVSLLGQTFLARVDSVTIKGDEMVLR